MPQKLFSAEQIFVSEVNRLIAHLQLLSKKLHPQLDYFHIPSFEDFVPARNVSEAQTLLDKYFTLEKQKNKDAFVSSSFERRLCQIQELHWKKGFTSQCWPDVINAADHDPNQEPPYLPYGFKYLNEPSEPLNKDFYLNWLKNKKIELNILSKNALFQTADTNLEIKDIELNISSKNTLFTANTNLETKSAVWAWCKKNRRFTVPLLMFLATIIILFPYVLPIIACTIMLAITASSIALNKTVRTFVENYKNILGGIMFAMSILLWFPIVLPQAAAILVKTFHLSIFETGLGSFNIMPSIDAAYGLAIILLGSLGIGFIATRHKNTENKEHKPLPESPASTSRTPSSSISSDRNNQDKPLLSSSASTSSTTENDSEASSSMDNSPSGSVSNKSDSGNFKIPESPKENKKDGLLVGKNSNITFSSPDTPNLMPSSLITTYTSSAPKMYN